MLDNHEFYLTLIRHGESEVNVQPDLMGQAADTALTDFGRKQAEALHLRFQEQHTVFDYIYSSDYTRAFDTAKIVKGNTPQPIILAPELREYSAGDWSGASRNEILTLPVKIRMGMLNHNFLPPNGESLHQVERRASKWLEDNILYNKDMIAASKIERADGSPLHIACFSHGMTIKCLFHYVLGFDQSLTWKITIDNTSISRLYFGKEGWRLISINDCAHLGY